MRGGGQCFQILCYSNTVLKAMHYIGLLPGTYSLAHYNFENLQFA